MDRRMVNDFLNYFSQSADTGTLVPLDYIEGTGSQYIDTGLKVYHNLDIEASIQFTSMTIAGGSPINGGYTSGNGLTYRADFAGIVDNMFWVGCSTEKVTTNVPADLERHTFHINTTTGEWSIDSVSGAVAPSTFVNSSIPLLIFDRGKGTLNSDKCREKVYWVKIKVDGVLVRNFVPMLSVDDNIAGLYDTISGKFYKNKGTGQFLYSTPLYAENPVLWIEADSAGQSEWTNKGIGGYNLTKDSYYNNPIIDGIAVTASQGNLLALKTKQNVVGTGSFTIEAVAAPSSALASTAYGGWLCEQRTNTLAQPGAFQCVFGSSKFSIQGWDANGVSISSGLVSLSYIPNTVQYSAAGYDADTKRLWLKLNSTESDLSNVVFSCTISEFHIGYARWNSGIPFLGSLYSLRVYQRSLSSQELEINRARDRLRFGF